MKKFGMVLGAAALAALAGCKDPDFKHEGNVQNEAKSIETKPAAESTVAIESTPEPAKPVAVEPVPAQPIAPAAKPESTTYVVQRGDFLDKLAHQFHVSVAAIKALNPSIKNNLIRIGQKLQIPGKHDVAAVKAAPVAKKPVAKKAAKGAPKGEKTAKKSSAPYTGPTKEYVVKSGDIIGKIAYENGLTIRQLRELNGLKPPKGDALRIGQKLKIPAEKVVATKEEKKVTPVAEPVVAPVVEEKPVEEAKPAETTSEAPVAPETEAAPAAPATAEPAPAPEPTTKDYVVQEGDDLTGVAIKFGTSMAQLRELNGLEDGNELKVGSTIKIPADAQQ